MALEQSSEAVTETQERPRDEAGRFAKQQAHDSAEAAVERMFGGGEPAETETQEAEQPVEEGQEQAPQEKAQQPEEVEVEIDGQKYLVPKGISDRFIQHADYTRKTQDIAEMRRALSAEREASNLEKAFEGSVQAERSRLSVLNAQIDHLQKSDWQSMETEQLLKARALLDQLKDARDELDTSIKSKRAEFDGKIKSYTQEAMQAGEKYIAQHIKGFNDETKKSLFTYGVSEGYTREEMDKIIDPRIVVSLWKAQQWDNLQASKPTTMKRASQAAPVVRPGATQKPVSRVQQLSKAVSQAKTPAAKKQAAEDYFAAKFGG